jgi:hypothetical protein
MHCREFEARLNEVLDSRGDPEADSRLLAHAHSCWSCQELLAGERALRTGLAQLAPPRPHPRLARRVVLEVAPHASLVASRASLRKWLAVGTLLGSAAAMLFAVTLVWQARRVAGPKDANRRDVVKTHHEPSPSGVALTQRAWLIEAPRLPGRMRGSIDNLAVTLPQTVEQLDQIEHLAPGLKPIRATLAVLWDTFRRAIPGASHEEPAKQRQRTGFWAADLLHLA